ncbi:MAG: transcription termination factor NusA, partial [Candidatus Zixiibacteriota bacterium]
IATAKQILVQKIREAEHERIYNEFIDKVGTIVSGVVQQIDKGNVIVNLGRGEGIMPPREQIPREKFRQGDRIRAFIADVQMTPRGPQILLSRNSNDFLRGLFALEVPEVYERIIEIKAIAREPGERAKVAVYSSDDRIDPVGACVGIKGVRVQSIVRELNNERIDIVPYTSNPELFVTRALAPAKVVTIDVYEPEQMMTVVVEDEKLSLAIGRNGQNARLASKLTGWKVNIVSESDYDEYKKREAEMLAPVGRLEGVGEKLTERLMAADINTVQRLSKTPLDVLTKIEGLGPKTAEALIERATAMVNQIEEEYKRKVEERKAAEAAAKEEKIKAEDIFASDADLAEDEAGEATEAEPADEPDAGDNNESDVEASEKEHTAES